MLIGSRALAHWVPEFKCKPSADWDFIGEQSVEVPEGNRVEIHPIDSLNNRDAFEFNSRGVCSLLGLTLIKRSHLHRDYKFDRHITMYHRFMLPNLQEFVVEGGNFLINRIRLTKQQYPQGNPSLNLSNDDFFDDAVTKVYDHDWLHELYAYEAQPMYTKLKKPEGVSQAWCEKDLWLELSYEDKCKCVAEECYVISTERFLVPKEFDYPAKLAYIKALGKVCTTLTSGWFRDFAIDNYPTIFGLYDPTKIEQTKGMLK